jgi:hypothetical protein
MCMYICISMYYVYVNLWPFLQIHDTVAVGHGIQVSSSLCAGECVDAGRLLMSYICINSTSKTYVCEQECLEMSVCLSLSIYRPIYLSFHLSINPSIYLSIFQCIFLSCLMSVFSAQSTTHHHRTTIRVPCTATTMDKAGTSAALASLAPVSPSLFRCVCVFLCLFVSICVCLCLFVCVCVCLCLFLWFFFICLYLCIYLGYLHVA